MLPSNRITRIGGFSVCSEADAYVFQPTNVGDIRGAFEAARAAGRKVALRGAGQSYGDPATLAEGVAVDLSRMNRILDFDAKSGVIDVEPGVTLEQIWRRAVESGFWLPVFSGTMKATVGGSISMNIHGKDHFSNGSFADHALEVELVTTDGRSLVLKPEDDRFWAVFGGLGLLGVVVRARLRLRRVTSGNVQILTRRARSLADHFALFDEFAATSAAVVSWLDCYGRGQGIFEAAVLGEPDESTLTESHQESSARIAGFPRSMAWRLLKLGSADWGVRLFNALRYMRAGAKDGSSRSESLSAFSYQLDSIPNWRNAFLPGGLIQFQSFVPLSAAERVFEGQITRQREEGLVSYLAVMKRHRPDRTLLSYSLDGYSLALDFRLTDANASRLRAMLLSLAEDVVTSGGRFYFAKDAILTPDLAARSLGEESVAQFRILKRELDPEGLLTSGLAQRVRLLEPDGVH